MKRWIVAVAVLALLLGAFAVPGWAQDNQANLRVVQASPDAPAMDVVVNDNTAFPDLAYKDITDYQAVDAGSVHVQLVPTGDGDDESALIDVNVDLEANTDYTIVAVGQVDGIEPLVLVDDNTPPPPGQARVRFVHASPDAPAVDVAVEGATPLFTDVAFKGVGNYATLDAGTVNLEVREAGTSNVVLSVPNVELRECTVYTIYAVGLAEGEPPLEAITSTDAETDCETPAPGATAPPAAAAVRTVAPTVVSTPQAVRSATPGAARTGTPRATGTAATTQTAGPTRTGATTVTAQATSTGGGPTATKKPGGLTRVPTATKKPGGLTRVPTIAVGVRTAAPFGTAVFRTPAPPTPAVPPGGPPLVPPPNQ